MSGFRYANIGAAVGGLIMLAGALIFGEREGPLILVVLLAFVVAGVVYNSLWDHAKQRRDRRDQ